MGRFVFDALRVAGLARWAFGLSSLFWAVSLVMF